MIACLGGPTILAVDPHFPVSGATLNTVPAAVIADAAVVDVMDDLAVVDVFDTPCVDTVVLAVVVEVSVLPVAARISRADIAEPIVDAAVIADVLAPVAGIPTIDVIDIAPVAGGPQRPHKGRQTPGAGHPVIAPPV
ncbi:hypothetical protein GCM10027565_47130 [Bordetella tumulicola]